MIFSKKRLANLCLFIAFFVIISYATSFVAYTDSNTVYDLFSNKPQSGFSYEMSKCVPPDMEQGKNSEEFISPYENCITANRVEYAFINFGTNLSFSEIMRSFKYNASKSDAKIFVNKNCVMLC